MRGVSTTAKASVIDVSYYFKVLFLRESRHFGGQSVRNPSAFRKHLRWSRRASRVRYRLGLRQIETLRGAPRRFPAITFDRNGQIATSSPAEDDRVRSSAWRRMAH